MALRHGPAWALVALVALSVPSGSSSASVRGTLVRQVRAVSSPGATRILVDIDGSFTHETTVSRDGRAVVVRIGGAGLAEGASRVLPVADPRVDGVLVSSESATRGVRIAIDVAGSTAPVVLTEAVGAGLRVTLSSARATPRADGAAPPSRVDGRGRAASPSAANEPHASREPATPGVARPTPSPEAGRKPPAPSEAAPPPASQRPGRPADAGAKAGAVPIRRKSVVERSVVVLDPGHGGRDPGATAWTGELEKDIVLDLASRVARRLRERGDIDVVMTRTGDEYVGLEDRRDASSLWGADVFVSLHANASPSAAARGIETYYHAESSDRAVRRLAKAENDGRAARTRVSRTAAASSLADPADSRRLAESVQTQLVRHLGMRYEAVRDLGAKEGPFFVIGGNAAPSVLVEAAFLTHREEGLRMGSQVYRERIAEGVARGILGFLDDRAGPGAW